MGAYRLFRFVVEIPVVWSIESEMELMKVSKRSHCGMGSYSYICISAPGDDITFPRLSTKVFIVSRV